MIRRKTLKELTIKDNFMFGAVMCVENNCRRLLELVSGKEYVELPNTYIIFICDFDPFGLGKYRYTFKHMCCESPGTYLEDGSETVFLNTRGTNPEEVSTELVKFLKYVRADLAESMINYEDEFVEALQRSVHEIKQSRRMEERYMLTELLMQDERRAGRIEGRRESILEVLEEIGTISNELRERIVQEANMDQLKIWAKLAARVDSIEQFMEEM